MNCGDDIGMAMSGGYDGNACGEIEKHVTVDVGDCGASATLGDERISARVGRGNISVVQLEDFFGLRAGERSD